MKKIALFLTILLSLSSYGCSSNLDFTVPKQDITVEVIVKSEGVEFWDVVIKGAEDAAEELGINVICEATPTEADIDKQIELLQNAINNNIDAIVFGPLDTNLDDTLQVATSKSIPIITIDSAVNYSEVKSLVGTQNETAGAIGARQMASLLNEKGNVLIVAHGDDNVSTAKQRKNGFINEINENHKDIKILDVLNGQANTETAKSLVLDYLQKNPDIKGIYACNESVALGVCEAIIELNRNDIKIIGFDSSEAEIKYLEDGVLSGMLVQNPYLFGYLGVRNAYKTINGESIDSFIDTGITYVDITNLNDADVQSILYPMGKE
ncbi:MAG: ABC transporter substrate-binding protein [Oscillospiraceae bacterium]